MTVMLFAGVVSWTIIYPVDMLKSRIQTDGITSRKYTSAYDCLQKSIKSGGVSSLFRGLTPTIIRAFPVNAVTFSVVTWTMRLCDGTYFVQRLNQPEGVFQQYVDIVSRTNAWEYSIM